MALEHKDLKVQSQMSATIFLDVEAPAEKTIFVDVRNTSDKDIDVASLIKSRLEQKGYAVVASAQQASYVIQANVLQVGMANPSALHDALGAGWGGPLAGGVAGALIGGNRTSNSYAGAMNGAEIGGLIGGAGEMVEAAGQGCHLLHDHQRPDRAHDVAVRTNRAVQSPAEAPARRRPIEREHDKWKQYPRTASHRPPTR